MHEFKVWAPTTTKVSVKVAERVCAMEGPNRNGWWKASVEEAGPGSDYGFLVDDDPKVYPDPRSPWQPNGVHAMSRVYDHKSFEWHDSRWQAPPLASAVIYELHVGTFTPGGTFDGAIERLDYLHELGITHI